MNGISRATLLGKISKDIEVRSTNTGLAVCDVNIAVEETKYVGDEEKTFTNYFMATAFGKVAEYCQEHLGKGSFVYVEGKLENQSYEDKETGKKMYKTKIVANVIQLIGDLGATIEKPAPSRKESFGKEDFGSDDIPF